MFKKVLSILIVVGLLFAFAFPENTAAAPPKWWKIVKADVIGALDGYLEHGSFSGAVIGGIKGSIEASKAQGASGGSWEPGATVRRSVGLHHNLGLNYLYENMEFRGGELLPSEREKILQLLRDYAAKNDLEPDGLDRFLSLEEVERGLPVKLQTALREGRISEEFYRTLNEAINLLDADYDDPQIIKERATALLQRPFPGKEDNAIAEVYIDILSFSFDYWKEDATSDEIPREPIASPEKHISLTVENKQALVNGSAISLDVAPFIRNGRTLVPFRFIGEQLGAAIGWNPADRSVSYKLGDREILLFIGSTTAIVDGQEVTLETPPVIENSRTVVPVRFISENLGFSVEWKPDIREIIIRGGTGPYNPN